MVANARVAANLNVMTSGEVTASVTQNMHVTSVKPMVANASVAENMSCYDIWNSESNFYSEYACDECEECDQEVKV